MVDAVIACVNKSTWKMNFNDTSSLINLSLISGGYLGMSNDTPVFKGRLCLFIKFVVVSFCKIVHFLHYQVLNALLAPIIIIVYNVTNYRID